MPHRDAKWDATVYCVGFCWLFPFMLRNHMLDFPSGNPQQEEDQTTPFEQSFLKLLTGALMGRMCPSMNLHVVAIALPGICWDNPRNSRFKAEPPWAAIPIPTRAIWETPHCCLNSSVFSRRAIQPGNCWAICPIALDCTSSIQVVPWFLFKLMLGCFDLIPSLKKTHWQHWQPTALLLRLAQDICGTSDPYVEVYVNDVKQVRLWFRAVSQVIYPPSSFPTEFRPQGPQTISFCYHFVKKVNVG